MSAKHYTKLEPNSDEIEVPNEVNIYHKLSVSNSDVISERFVCLC